MWVIYIEQCLCHVWEFLRWTCGCRRNLFSEFYQIPNSIMLNFLFKLVLTFWTWSISYHLFPSGYIAIWMPILPCSSSWDWKEQEYRKLARLYQKTDISIFHDNSRTYQTRFEHFDLSKVLIYDFLQSTVLTMFWGIPSKLSWVFIPTYTYIHA